jgi:hypothetical protein
MKKNFWLWFLLFYLLIRNERNVGEGEGVGEGIS